MTNLEFLQNFVSLKDVMQKIFDYNRNARHTKMTVSVPFLLFIQDWGDFLVAPTDGDGKDTDTEEYAGSLRYRSDMQIDVFVPRTHPMEGFILDWDEDFTSVTL